MYRLLFILFIVKLYAGISIFKRLKKHGQDIYKLSKTLENQISQHRISFIKQCKKENIIPTFAKINVAIRHGTYELEKKIAHTVMVTGLQKKHHERRKSKKDIIKTAGNLPVRRVITGNLPVRRVITGNLSVRRVITGKLPIRRVITGNLPDS